MDKRLMLFLYVVFFICAFLFILVMDLIKIKKRKSKNISELQYLVNKFNIDTNKLKLKKTCIIIALIDSFIITTVVLIISLIDDAALTIQLMVGFILLFTFIYLFYEIYGRILVIKGCVKKENNKEVKKENKKAKKRGSKK